MLLGGTGLAGLGAAGAAIYRMAPGFVNQIIADRERKIAPAQLRPTPRLWPDHGLHAAWLGHSTVLLKLDGFTVITDPLLYSHAGVDLRFTQVGMKRLVDAALTPEELPPIDLILLSHAHFDHLDTRTLRALESPKTEVIMARSTSDLIRADRYRRVTELGWGESVRVGPLEIRAHEVRHWGARLRTDTYRGYNGYVLDSGARRVLFAGDTAETDAFRALKTSRGIDLAIVPIGAYNPWIHAHCTPEQALRMGLDAGAARFLPVHHQTFRLSREAHTEPIERFQAAAARLRVPVVLDSIGQQVVL
ncbi:MAG: MBL fold metallo-hydrolase [Bryobacteraceae bacterium]|nr:MBL fold metallo-hydrolase [Bryobacteraceae bacterium]